MSFDRDKEDPSSSDLSSDDDSYEEDTGNEDRDGQDSENIGGDVISRDNDPKKHAQMVKFKIEEFFQKIKGVKQSIDTQNTLYEEYKVYIKPQDERVKVNIPSPSARNILHKIVADGKDGNALPPEHWAVGRLAEDYPELLEDDDPEPPLFRATKQGMVWYINVVLNSKMDRAKLRGVLGPSCKDEGISSSSKYPNCIAEAIKQGLNAEVVINLIKAASEHTLATQDSYLKTPLHYAVEFQHCKRNRNHLEVIQALLDKGDRALDTRMGPPHCFSVYEHHMHTRPTKNPDESYPGRDNTKQEFPPGMGRKKTDPDPDIKRKQGNSITRIKAESSGKDKEKFPSEKPKEGEQDLERPNGPDLENESQPSRLSRRPTGTLDAKNAANQGRPLSDTRLKKAEQSPAPRAKKPKKSHKSGSLSESDKVAKLLKLHFFRTTFRPKTNHSIEQIQRDQRDHNSAERFLYGKNAGEKYLCFTFAPKPEKTTKMNFDDFQNLYKTMAFDPILLYVNFGSFDLQPPVRDPRAKQTHDSPTGKRDLEQFFKWLSGKGVEHIIKVKVDDNRDPPHCDESIIESLKKFDVEILDWQKTDLCPFVIQQASQRWSAFHELHLRWSGNNAVLRAWSEPEGLASLKNLSTIYIHQVKAPLDSQEYIKARTKDFEERLNRSRETYGLSNKIEVKFNSLRQEKPKLDVTKASESSAMTKAPSDEKINEHQWLNIMDAFADCLTSLRAMNPPGYHDEFHQDDKIVEILKEDVTIALIDDGVDFLNPLISESLKGGKCFPNGFGEHDVAGAPDPPFHESTTEHGTNMAYQIRRICPAAKIFACKIDMIRQPPPKKATFTAKSAADAVEYAIEHKFDIVSMSWSIEDDGDAEASKDLARLRDKLQECAKAGKPLFFCSAPDIGQPSSANLYYPFGCNDVQNKFKIGAATADGGTNPWTGKEAVYNLPGTNVSLRDEDKLDEAEKYFPKTGSSIATALAAGLAALIIHCVRLGAIYNHQKGLKNGVTSTTLTRIKTFNVMKAAFDQLKSLAGDNNSENRLGIERMFVDPEKKLRVLEEGPDFDSDEKKWEIIAGLARTLVSQTMEEKASRNQ